MKRKDLQGLRGFAIIAVVIFHFFPHLCPSGYLGVDLFFVLSGFLITMILGRSEFGLKALSEFYYRRVKRIVPLYYLITCIIASSVLFLLPLTFIIVNVEPFGHSILFLSNIGKPNDLNYFAELDHAKNLFTHTWSLSVEMQYYLLVPFIYYALTKTPSYLHTALFLLICMISLTYQCTADSNTAFNSVFARLWQFTIGSIACLCSPENEHKYVKISINDDNETLQSDIDIQEEKNLGSNQNDPNITCIIVVLIFLMSFGQVIDQIILLRIIVTCLSGVITASGNQNFNQSVLLTNPVIVYIGDISYSLYLVHWPICVCIENYYTGMMEASIMGIISSFLLAIVLKETYEKWYLQANYITILRILIVLAGLNYLVWRAVAPKLHPFNKNKEIIYNVNCEHEKENEALGWCDFRTGLDKKGNNTGLIIGNSYAANLGGLVWENCGKKMKKLRQYSAYACEPLILTQNRYKGKCAGEFAKFLKFVQEEKPDYIFILARWMDLSVKTPVGLEDEALKAAENEWKIKAFGVYSQRYKVDKENARSDDLFLQEIDANSSRSRLETLAKKFPKMSLIDIQPPLTINGSFRIADPSNGIFYFTTDQHISPHGTNRISPAFKDACSLL